MRIKSTIYLENREEQESAQTFIQTTDSTTGYDISLGAIRIADKSSSGIFFVEGENQGMDFEKV